MRSWERRVKLSQMNLNLADWADFLRSAAGVGVSYMLRSLFSCVFIEFYVRVERILLYYIYSALSYWVS